MTIERAIHLYNTGEFKQSVKLLDKLLKYEPKQIRALYWRASVLIRLERYHDALTDLDKAIDIYDEYADAYSQRGVVKFHLKKLGEALTDMDKAVELEPENPYRYSSRAYILSTAGELEEAYADYMQAVELDPDDAVAKNNLDLVVEKLGYKAKELEKLQETDQMLINRYGELIEIPRFLESEHEPYTPDPHRTFFEVVKDIFFSREGFTDYLNYIRKMFKK